MFPDYASVKAYLYGLKHHSANYGIDRMRVFSSLIGNPELQYPVIHVAGTNGKGSVCAMVDSVLRRQGWKTGLFTSPHLVRQGERIQVNRTILDEEEIRGYVNEWLPLTEKLKRESPEHHPSFFEYMTAMAFLHFAREGVDAAVIEVGMGGRLDATNIVQPAVTAIVSIGLDHCDVLGDTLAKIAFEKAGIIKPGIPVVMGPVPQEAEDVIRRVASERQAPLISVVDVFGRDETRYPETSLPGWHQRRNAATAWLICQQLRTRFQLSDEAIRSGLRLTEWSGRWERKEVAKRNFIFDVSHNREGAAELEKLLVEEISKSGRRPHIVFGVLGELRAKYLVPVVAKHAETLYLVRPMQSRSSGFEEMERFLPQGVTCPVVRTQVDDLFPGYLQSKVGREGDTIVVTGSIYLLGEVMERLLSPVPVGQAILQDWI